MADKSNAPGQLLGYGLQITRLTALLFEAAEGTSCSVEAFDDVAVQSNNSFQLTQTKSALTGNPVSNRSIQLWKTLAIWARLSSNGNINPRDTSFEIYVSKPVNGTIVDSFAKANSSTAAKQALSSAKDLMYGTAAVPQTELPEDLKKHVDEFFSIASNLSEQIVIGFRLTCASGSPHSDLEELIRKHPVSPSKVSDIADHMCGWVKRECEKLLELQQPAVISRDEFHKKYLSYCHRIDRQVILQSASKPLDTEIARTKIDDEPTFVRQLMLIKTSYDELLRAVSDCLRAATDRTAWAKSGEVDDESLIDLNDSLQRSWQNHKSRCDLLHNKLDEIDRGKHLLLDCMTFQTTVQGMQVPPYFVAGCFHILADEPVIGWHPDYVCLLESRAGEENA